MTNWNLPLTGLCSLFLDSQAGHRVRQFWTGADSWSADKLLLMRQTERFADRKKGKVALIAYGHFIILCAKCLQNTVYSLLIGRIKSMGVKQICIENVHRKEIPKNGVYQNYYSGIPRVFSLNQVKFD